MQFGQFLAHDISKTTLVPSAKCNVCQNIPVSFSFIFVQKQHFHRDVAWPSLSNQTTRIRASNEILASAFRAHRPSVVLDGQNPVNSWMKTPATLMLHQFTAPRQKICTSSVKAILAFWRYWMNPLNSLLVTNLKQLHIFVLKLKKTL